MENENTIYLSNLKAQQLIANTQPSINCNAQIEWTWPKSNAELLLLASA